jgi:hypothetical protein
MSLTKLRDRVAALLETTADVESIYAATSGSRELRRYGEVEWKKVIGFLFHQIPPASVQDVMLSNYPRWAADRAYTKRATMEDFVRFFHENIHLFGRDALTKLKRR